MRSFMIVLYLLSNLRIYRQIQKNLCKVIGLLFLFFPGGGDLGHSVGLGAGGNVDVGFHGFVVGVAGPFHDYLGRDAAGEGETDEGASAGLVQLEGEGLTLANDSVVLPHKKIKGVTAPV